MNKKSKGSSRMIWMESSFVGTRPVDSPTEASAPASLQTVDHHYTTTSISEVTMPSPSRSYTQEATIATTTTAIYLTETASTAWIPWAQVSGNVEITASTVTPATTTITTTSYEQQQQQEQEEDQMVLTAGSLTPGGVVVSPSGADSLCLDISASSSINNNNNNNNQISPTMVLSKDQKQHRQRKHHHQHHHRHNSNDRESSSTIQQQQLTIGELLLAYNE